MAGSQEVGFVEIRKLIFVFPKYENLQQTSREQTVWCAAC